MKSWVKVIEITLLAIIALTLIVGQLNLFDSGSDLAGPEGVVNLVQWKSSIGGNDHWYGLVDQELFWEQARDLAPTLKLDGKSGYLATVKSYPENDFIISRVIAGSLQPSILDGYWLGGEKADSTWRWITGEPFTFENWSLYEPNNPKNETALSLWGPSNWGDRSRPGQWNNLLPNGEVNRLHRTWSVVEWGEYEMGSDTNPPDTLINLSLWSPESGGNNHWYAIVALDRYFYQMDEIASQIEHQGIKGHLATISSAEENSFIIDIVVGQFRQSSKIDQFWLGGTESDGEWRWLDGSVWEYTNWAPREPNNPGQETALAMWGPSAHIKGRRPGLWNNCLPDDEINPLGHFYGIIEFDTPR